MATVSQMFIVHWLNDFNLCSLYNCFLLRITHNKFDDYSRISPFFDAIDDRVDPIYTS